MSHGFEQFVIGFIVEEEKILQEQMEQKLLKKNLDIVIGNSIEAINSKKNKICILDNKGSYFETSLLDKSEIAKIVLRFIKDSIIANYMLYL